MEISQEVNYCITFHGMLSDKIIKVLPDNTNLIIPSCCGNYNYSLGMEHQSYFKFLQTEVVDKIRSHRPKIVRLKKINHIRFIMVELIMMHIVISLSHHRIHTKV